MFHILVKECVCEMTLLETHWGTVVAVSTCSLLKIEGFVYYAFTPIVSTRYVINNLGILDNGVLKSSFEI